MKDKKEKITVSKFVEGYNKLTNEQLKSKYVDEHILTTYSPILNKINILTIMNEKSVSDSPEGKYIDMSVSKMNFIMAILVLYTDITPDKSVDDIPLTCDAYDSLKSTGLLEEILERIGADVEELMSVQSSVMETWHMKNKSTEAYIVSLIDTASKKFGVYAGAGMEKLADALDDEVKVKRLITILDKVFKK